MLKREKDTYRIFRQAITRNYAFLRIHNGLQWLMEYVNYSYDEFKPDLLKQIPEILHGTTIHMKVEESSDAYGLIDNLDREDVPHVVDNIHSFPIYDTIENIGLEDAIDEEVILKYLPMFKDGVQLIKDNPLNGDILVSAVTAFEVYLRDTLHDLIVNNNVIARKFEDRIKARLNISDELTLTRDTNLFIAHEVTHRSSFYRVNSIEDLYHHCLREPGYERYRIHTSKGKRDSVQYYLKLRNLLVHNGGIVDQQFMKEADCKNALGEQVPVPAEDVLEFIGYTEGITERIEKEIENY